jgi:hypothetical protein
MVTGMTASQSSPEHRRSRTPAAGRALALLGVLAVALGAAFVVAPGVLAESTPGGGYSGEGAVITAMRTAFAGYWNSGSRNYPPGLERLVDYWIRYHVAKAVIAAALLTVLVALGACLLRALMRPGRLAPGRGAALASCGALAAMLAFFAAVLVAVNIQDAVAPFASLISLLPLGTSNAQFTATVGQVRQRLAGYPGAAGRTPPALEAMVSDFALYHAALVVLLAVLAVVLIGLSVASWRKRARTASSERRIRRTLVSASVLSALLSLAVIVVAVANLNTAMHPAPALLAFFTGGAGGL